MSAEKVGRITVENSKDNSETVCEVKWDEFTKDVFLCAGGMTRQIDTASSGNEAHTKAEEWLRNMLNQYGSVEEALKSPSKRAPQTRVNEKSGTTPDLNHLLQKVVDSFSDHPYIKLRFICFDRTDSLGRALIALEHGGPQVSRTPESDLDFDAVGHDRQSKEKRVEEALDTLGKIISGESTKYTTMTLLVVDRKILNNIQDRFKGKCPILGWIWNSNAGIVDTFEIK